MGEIGDEAGWEPTGSLQQGMMGARSKAMGKEVERRGQVNRSDAFDLVTGHSSEKREASQT